MALGHGRVPPLEAGADRRDRVTKLRVDVSEASLQQKLSRDGHGPGKYAPPRAQSSGRTEVKDLDRDLDSRGL